MDAQHLQAEWEEWLEAFEYEAATKKSFTQKEMFNLLMAEGERNLQRIFKNKKSVDQQRDRSTQRLFYRQDKQANRSRGVQSEPFYKFMIRLRTQGEALPVWNNRGGRTLASSGVGRAVGEGA